LERELEEAQLKAEAYSKMIEIWLKRELKISIRKKYNTNNPRDERQSIRTRVWFGFVGCLVSQDRRYHTPREA